MGSLRSWAADVVLAVVVTLIGIAGTFGAERWAFTHRPVDGIAVALVAANGLALVLRRRQPVAAVLIIAALTSTYLVLDYPYGPVLLALLIAVYSVARHRPLATSVPAALGALAMLLVHVFVGAGFMGVVPGSGWVVVPFAVGTVVRLQRESAARARSEQMRQRVDDERLRIAQEVHDVVGHGLAAIKMQAEVALHVLPKKPEQAETALTAISKTSSDALDELRATLAVVRRTGSQEPAPGLARLDDLTQRMRDAGLQVELTTTGEPRELPTAVDLTGYRILQESLTNVLRHSNDKRATVTIDYAADSVNITVTNPFTGAVGDSGGLGISGMRQRVTSLDGEFTAGRVGDRFEVHARLPIEGRP